jgi:tRNA modification GTPase
MLVGLENTTEGIFSARTRHVDALYRAQTVLIEAVDRFQHTGAGELLAEDLKQIQQCLGEITGQFSSDELLGRIFSSFCIGK